MFMSNLCAVFVMRNTNQPVKTVQVNEVTKVFNTKVFPKIFGTTGRFCG